MKFLPSTVKHKNTKTINLLYQNPLSDAVFRAQIFLINCHFALFSLLFSSRSPLTHQLFCCNKDLQYSEGLQYGGYTPHFRHLYQQGAAGPAVSRGESTVVKVKGGGDDASFTLLGQIGLYPGVR